MNDGLLAFLNYVGPFIKFTRLYDSDTEELKSPINKKLSQSPSNLSRVLLTRVKK